MAEATRVRFGEARETYPGKPFAKQQDKNTRKGHLTGDRPSETDSGKFQELVPRYNKEASTDLLHVVVVRHGESLSQAGRLIEGHTDSELTDRGNQEVILLGRMLSREHIAMMYHSDLGRVQTTMDIICKCRAPDQQCEMRPTELLRERNAGHFEGEEVGRIEQAARGAGMGPREYRPAAGESWEDVQLRAEDFMQEMLETHLPPPSAAAVAANKLGAGGAPKENPNIKTVLVGTHSGFIKELVAVMGCYGGGRHISTVSNGQTVVSPGKPRWPSNSAQGEGAFNYPNKAKSAAVYRFNMMWHNGRLTVAMVEENDTTHLRSLPTAGPVSL